jgi:hypothetical protein
MSITDIYNLSPNTYALEFKVPLDVRDISISDIREAIDKAYYYYDDDEAGDDTQQYIWLNAEEKQHLEKEIIDLILRIMFSKYTELPQDFFKNNSYIYVTDPNVIGQILYLIYGLQNPLLTERFNDVLDGKVSEYTWKNIQIVYMLAGPISKGLLSHWFNLNKIKFLLPFENGADVKDDDDEEKKLDAELGDLEDIYRAYMAEMGAGFGLGLV